MADVFGNDSAVDPRMDDVLHPADVTILGVGNVILRDDRSDEAVLIDFGVSISALPILKPWVSIPFRSINMQLNIGKKGE